MLGSHTQTSALRKVKAHANINGNEQAYTLAKKGRTLDHKNVVAPYEQAHPTP